MGVEENKVIMQRYFDELMNNRDYSKADEILHPEYTGSAGGGLQGVEGHKQVHYYAGQSKHLCKAQILKDSPYWTRRVATKRNNYVSRSLHKPIIQLLYK